MPGLIRASGTSREQPVPDIKTVKKTEFPVYRERSVLQNSISRLFRNKAAAAGMVFLAAVLLVFCFADTSLFSLFTGQEPAPLIAPMRYDGANFAAVNAPPGSRVVNSHGKEEYFIFGADQLGRDVLSRVLYGTRVSFSVAVIAATISLVIGLIYGTVAGYSGGAADNIMMRVVDFLWGLPFIIIVILLQTYFKALSRQGSSSTMPIYSLAAISLGLILFYIGASSVAQTIDAARGKILSRLLRIQVVLGLSIMVLVCTSISQLIYLSILALFVLVHIALLCLLLFWGNRTRSISRSAAAYIVLGDALFIIGLALLPKTVNLIGIILNADKKMGGMLMLFFALGLLNWTGMSRLARSQVLSIKEKDFVQAAKSLGASDLSIIIKHLVPNILGPLIVQEMWAIPNYIFTEAFLSFIGLGVDPPTPSWGIMISESVPSLRAYPWQTLVPAAALTLTALAMNFLGDGLRDAIDPRL